MGGYRSGRWARSTRKWMTSECYIIDAAGLSDLWRQAVGTRGVTSWTDGFKATYTIHENRAIQLSYELKARRYEVTVRLQSTQCNYGGYRMWATCPLCQRRVGKLYQPFVLSSYGFACRKCHDLSYRSRQESGDVVMYYADRIRRIAKKLGASGSETTPSGSFWLPRPKGMHHKSYERLSQSLTEAREAYFNVSNAEMEQLIERLENLRLSQAVDVVQPNPAPAN